MQRSITNQKPLIQLLLAGGFVVYIGLSSIYLFLPPLLAVLFLLLSRSLDKKEAFSSLLLLLCLLLFEAEKHYWLFSSIIYFAIVYKLILPKLYKVSNCKPCIHFATVIIVYLGYFLFVSLLANIFLLSAPNLTYYLIYYILIEFFIVSLL